MEVNRKVTDTAGTNTCLSLDTATQRGVIDFFRTKIPRFESLLLKVNQNRTTICGHRQEGHGSHG